MPADIGDFARKRIGTMLKGKYRIHAVLGVGGMAIVYKATHRNTKEFAIKMLRAEVSADHQLRERFLREGYVANSVKHPDVVSVVDDDVDENGCAFLVMELLEGASVDDVLGKLGGVMPAPPACAIIARVLDVLAAAHERGIFHRDIKPANVFITKNGDVKVLDFGIAKVLDATLPTATTTGAAYGTPAFMAPEQALGTPKAIDARADVWQCGASLFTMLTGRFVHEAETPQLIMIYAATKPAPPIASVLPTIHPELARVIDRALAFDKSARWQTAGEFRDALAACSAEIGGTMDRAGLAALVASASAALQDTRRLDAPLAIVAATTARPVSSDKRRGVGAPIGLLVVALVVSALAAITLVVTWKAGAAKTPATQLVSASTAPPLASTSDVPIATIVATSTASAPTTTASIRATAAVTSHPSPHPSASANNCSPNYRIDADGNKHFKPECFR